MDLGSDRSVVDALSWRLASELYRRHPQQLALNRGHPGGGLYDCLMLFSAESQPGRIMLNRVGTIQVHDRFDGRGDSSWRPCGWEDYLRADPHGFLLALEEAAGLRPPGRLPPSTTAALAYRLFAVLTSLVAKTRHPYSVEQAYIDSSGDDFGPNDAIDAFPGAAQQLRREREAPDQRGEPGFDYWMVFQADQPRWALNRDSGTIWTAHGECPKRLPTLYKGAGRDMVALALRLLEVKQP